MATQKKNKKKIKRHEFQRPGESDTFIVFGGHHTTPFWRSKKCGIRFTSSLSYPTVRRLAKKRLVSKMTYPSSQAEFKKYLKLAKKQRKLSSLPTALPSSIRQ